MRRGAASFPERIAAGTLDLHQILAPATAAMAATSTIPIVFQTGSDPVKDGLVASLNRTGGNVTGATRLADELIQKRLGLISELVPKATKVALLMNPNRIQTPLQVQENARGGARTAWRSTSCMQVAIANWRRPSRPSHNLEPLCSSKVAIRSLSISAKTLSR